MLIYTQQSRTDGVVVKSCRRCGQSGLESGIAVCTTCRAQEEVALHIPPAQRWSFIR